MSDKLTYRFAHFTIEDKLPLPPQLLWELDIEATIMFMIEQAKAGPTDGCNTSKLMDMRGITARNAILSTTLSMQDIGVTGAMAVQKTTGNIYTVSPTLYPCVHVWVLEQEIHPTALPLVIDVIEGISQQVQEELRTPKEDFTTIEDLMNVFLNQQR